MPKEVIRAALLPYGDDDPAKSVAELRWDRDAGNVQLVTRCVRVDDGSVYIPDHVKEALTGSGLQHTQMLRSEGSEVVYVAQDGWFIDLDRRGLNLLIRTARRARDQAFGRDE